jgi:hypothetical protein
MKPKSEIEEELDGLESDLKIFHRDLDNEKQKLIRSLKGITKDELIPKPEKLTLWQRLKRVINI